MRGRNQAFLFFRRDSPAGGIPKATAAALFALVVAGCLGGGYADDLSNPEKPPEGTFALRGLVVDDVLLPIAGAAVTADGRHRTHTDAAGSFVLFLAPGEHELAISAAGFEDLVEMVQVSGAEGQQATFVLKPLGSVVPYHETMMGTGFVALSLSYSSSRNSYINPLAPLSLVGGEDVDKFKLFWPVGSLTNASGFWLETTWSSTQLFGTSLDISWNINTDGQGISGREFAGVAGPDPARARAPIENVTAIVEDNPSPPSKCGVEECEVLSIHSAIAQNLPVGIVFQQRYDEFLTVFRHGPLPADFTALPDE